MAAFGSSHCVAAGKGIPSWSCSRSKRWKGVRMPYFNSASIAIAVASYLSAPAASSASAVKI